MGFTPKPIHVCPHQLIPPKVALFYPVAISQKGWQQPYTHSQSGKLHFLIFLNQILIIFRRAHLKDCFDALKAQVPNMEDKKIKTSNLSILQGALRYLQVSPGGAGQAGFVLDLGTVDWCLDICLIQCYYLRKFRKSGSVRIMALSK